MALEHDEKILLEGCRQGDEAAWLALYRAHASDVGTYLRGMLRDPGELDDLVQKVFLAFLSSLDRFKGECSIRTWLHRIARNVALNDLRSRKRRQSYVKAYAETVKEPVVNPEGALSARHHLALIGGLLTQLKESFREVWLLREVMGLSVAEVADILEVEEATVRTRHHRARKRILELLREVDSFDDPGKRSAPVALKLIKSGGTAQ